MEKQTQKIIQEEKEMSNRPGIFDDITRGLGSFYDKHLKNNIMFQSGLRNLPLIGGLFKAYDDAKYAEDYLNNTGLTPDDIKYPSRFYSSGSWGSSMSAVFEGIEKFYKGKW